MTVLPKGYYYTHDDGVAQLIYSDGINPRVTLASRLFTDTYDALMWGMRWLPILSGNTVTK